MRREGLLCYEAPEMEIVDLELNGILCTSTNAENVDIEGGEDGGDL